jgi:hypothetical protein
MEGAEGRSIGPDMPMHPWFSQQRVRHILQEVRARDQPIIEYYYDHGYHCKDSNHVDRPFHTRAAAVAWIRSITGQGFSDAYCTLIKK